MAPVARTEPTPEIPSLTDRHTAEVRANTEHDEPLGLLHPVGILLRVAQFLPVGVFGFFDFAVGPVADEDGLAAPFDDYLWRGGGVRLLQWSRVEYFWHEKEVEEVRGNSHKGGPYVLALGDAAEVDFDFGLREDVGGCGHVDEEICERRLLSAGVILQFCSPSQSREQLPVSRGPPTDLAL